MSITDKSAEADFFLWHFRGNINFLPQKLAYVRIFAYLCGRFNLFLLAYEKEQAK